MALQYTLFRSFVNPGDLVVCHGIAGFPQSKMPARVLADQDMHRPARKGFAWVREVQGLKNKLKGGEPFVIEWPSGHME